ncbi:hypothetical protein H0H93_011345 [Arthromyces matolae]|nr:hypothetical protein H0H93_011345 [Arthromyces matolae]
MGCLLDEYVLQADVHVLIHTFEKVSPPQGQPSLVLRALTPAHDLRLCNQMFPGAFSAGNNPQVNRTNELYHGWNVQQNRVFFANGQRDPWREASMSSDFANVTSTDSQPIAVSDGFHCSDLIAFAGDVDPTVRAVQDKALQYMAIWLAPNSTTTMV